LDGVNFVGSNVIALRGKIIVRLEDFRSNNIGSISAWVISLGDTAQAMTHLTFPQFCTSAFYISAEQIEQLELSSVGINQGNAVQTAVGLWFLSIESYINSLLRICCLLSQQSFEEYKKKDFEPRITALFGMLSIDKLPFYNGTFQRLEEFKRYRNELFHDRTNDLELNFSKTHFSGNPMFANQVDVMQAALIAIQVFESFRYVIPGVDLMPQVLVKKNDSFFYKCVDELYIKVLRPYFEMALVKHSLRSSIALDINAAPLNESQISSKGDVQILIRATPEEKYNHQPSPKKTNFGSTLFQTVKNEVEFDTKHSFMLPTYNRS